MGKLDEMMSPISVLGVLRLGRDNAQAHLTPLVACNEVRELRVLREEELELASAKVVWHVPRRRGRFPPLLRLFRSGLTVCRTGRVDVVIGFYLVPYGLLAWLIAKLTRKPVVLSLLGTDFNVHCHAWYASILRGVLRHSDFVTVTGRAMLEAVAAWGVSPDRLRILPHAIDVERFRSTTSPRDRSLDLLYVGRLLRAKRVDQVLRITAEVRERIPTARLAIVGEGPERERLEARARELGIEGCVEFAGYRDDVERFYRAARIFLLASEREGLPLVLVEAMCCGCVPISTRCGTIEDLIEDGKNGFLIRVGDLDLMARHASETLSDLERLEALSQKARETRESHALRSATTVWEGILAELQQGGSSAAS
jgi:glycosyltransferase involved in cell wall biosynthesis